MDPVMYEYAALAMQTHAGVRKMAEGARTLGDLQEGMKHFASGITRPECTREMCELHGDLDLFDRQLLAREEAAHFGAQPGSVASMFV